MKSKPSLSDSEVEKITRDVLERSRGRSESPDAVFLAAFRKKLAAYRRPQESFLTSIARLSWNLAPLTALATLILGVGLIWGPSQQTPSEEMWERVLQEIADEQKSEVSQDLLVEAVLLGPNGR